MSNKRLAIVGYGKMGRAIEQLALADGWEIASVIEHADAGRIDRETLAGAHVAVEFSEPAAAVPNVRAIVAAGCPVVVGTTGWYEQLPAVEEFVRAQAGAMLWAPNFAIGVQLMLDIARSTGALLASAESFDSHLIETHHAAKKDKPSGTALAIEKALREGLGRETPVTSVRTGHVPGTHELVFDSPYEQIRITHVARDRRVFASGALRAADWLRGRQGVFRLQDMLASTREKT